MVTIQYSERTRDFAFEWVNKWGQLVDSIFDLVAHDEAKFRFSPPTDLEETKYQKFRSWFVDHEAQFVPLWKDFYESRDRASNPNHEAFADASDNADNFEHPFQFVYVPKTLDSLILFLHIGTGCEIWYPAQERAPIICAELTSRHKKAAEFFTWIQDKVRSVERGSSFSY